MNVPDPTIARTLCNTRWRRTRRALAGIFLLLAGGIVTLLLAVPSPLPDAVTWPVSPALLDARGNLFHARLSEHEEFCLPISLNKMGAWLPLVAVEVEDRRFYSHFGVDFLALARASAQNIRAGSVVSGASTISSQVIRLTYPRRRTLPSKVQEFAQAVLLERHLSKEQILELYLNRAPFGGTVRGVEAAARSYFGKKAAELSLAESAMLIGMLRGPSLYRPDKNPGQTLARRNAILTRLGERNAAPHAAIVAAFAEKLPPGRGDIPQRHRHYADMVLRGLPAGYWQQGSRPVTTTLDPYVQTLLEARLDEALLPFPGSLTAAGAVMDNATGALLAYVGNARFDPAARGHWVDCGIAPRSPGSILKPFAYLTLMEQGSLVPATVLADTPLSFSGSAPRNYDRRYRGAVSAEFALAQSLNAPAVRVLRQAGGEAVIQRFRSLGFSLLNKPAAHYGDSLVLGGCEVTLLQTLQAFSTLATLGIHRPLTAIARPGGTPFLGEQRLFSAPAAYLVGESLREQGRMPPTVREALQAQGRSVAFKTGTSYGLRDAWTAAYTPAQTVVIWLGDPEGLPHPALSGLPLAAPIALRVIRDMPTDGQTGWHTPPPGLERYAACSFSGAPATPFCPDSKPSWRIRAVSRVVPCSVHVMRDGALQVILPPELAEYVATDNTRVAPRGAIDITMPQPGMRLFITLLAAEQNISLTCEGAQGTVYWFIDQEFFGMQKKGASLLWPLKPGKHTLSLVDEAGNTATASFSVINVLAQEPPPVRFAPEAPPVL